MDTGVPPAQRLLQQEAPPTFSLPGFYGFGGSQQVFSGGTGRLSRPRFRYSVNLSFGYDDNLFQTPKNPQGVPGATQEVLVSPEVPPTVVEQPVFGTVLENVGGGLLVPRRVQTGTRLVTVDPGRPAEFDTIKIPGIKPAERQGSMITRGSFNIEAQMATRRMLFTFDLSAGDDYHWDKKRDPHEYSGNVAFNFAYKFSPRLQFSASFSSSYLSQPDLSRPDLPDQPTAGSYIATNARSTLNYRWTPRFNTSVSTSYSSTYYVEQEENRGNYSSYFLGMEARYLWTPRLTVLGEWRTGKTVYEEDITRDSTSQFLLLGTEFILSRRLSGTLRFGQSVRTFEQSGREATSPYGEGSLLWRLTPRAVLQVNTRYGFEEPRTAGEDRMVFRTGANLSYTFTPRLTGTLGMNILHEVSSSEGASEDSVRDTFDGSLNLQYLLTRHFTLTLTYSYTSVSSNNALTEYDRSRFFFGGQYTF